MIRKYSNFVGFPIFLNGQQVNTVQVIQYCISLVAQSALMVYIYFYIKLLLLLFVFTGRNVDGGLHLSSTCAVEMCLLSAKMLYFRGLLLPSELSTVCTWFRDGGISASIRLYMS